MVFRLVEKLPHGFLLNSTELGPCCFGGNQNVK